MEEQVNKNYRYERKYILPKNQFTLTIQSLLNKNFYEVYNSRRINNIYFDTYHFNSVTENLEGLSNRKKTRVRWYGNSFDMSLKTIEVKIKNEFLNRKEKLDLGRFKINNFSSINSDVKFLKDEILVKNISFYNEIVDTIPTLYNSYERLYFYNPIENIRITIDNDLFFYSPITKSKYYEKELIIEAKFDKKTFFLNNFQNLNLTRYSKYVKGILKTSFSKTFY